MSSLLQEALRAPPAPTVSSHPLPKPPPERFTRRGLSIRPAPPDDMDDWIDVSELRPVLMTAAQNYLAIPDPGYVLLLAGPAGSGKTTLMVEVAEQLAAAGRRALYAGPRRDFWADTQALASRPGWWYEWLPRQEGDPDAGKPATCRHADAMGAWLARGYDAMTFCSNSRICGWDYVRDRCPYHRQKQRGEPIVYGQHAHVALGHPLMSQFHLIIGDELPLAAFLHAWHIPMLNIVPPEVEDPDLELLLRNLRFLCSVPPAEASAWEGRALYAALPGGAAEVVRVLEAAALPVDQRLIMPPELRSATSAETAPYGHLLTLCALLLREARRVAQGLEVIPRVQIDSAGLTLLLRRTPPPLPSHVIWLDATGDAPMYQALLGRPVQAVRPKVRLQGRVYQVWASTNNRGAVLDDKPDVAGEAKGKAKQELIRAQIARIVETHGYTQPAVISYKPLGDGLLPGADCSHFGGSRGTNRLQGCDALFVVGAPMPTTAAIKRMAAQVYFERDEPWCDDWHAVDVPFAGQAAAYTVGGYWSDPDLSTLVRQLREAEIVQAVHRARPLRRDVDVWLLTNVVAPDLPVVLVSLHQLFEAVDADGRPLTGVDVLRWPEVLALPATEDEPLTTTRLMDLCQISRPTAVRWFQALLATGRYTQVDLPPTSHRKRPIAGVVKRFQGPNK